MKYVELSLQFGLNPIKTKATRQKNFYYYRRSSINVMPIIVILARYISENPQKTSMDSVYADSHNASFRFLNKVRN